MRIFTFIFGILILTLTACSTANTSTKETKSELIGEWKLQNNNSNTLGLGEKPVSIAFDAEEKDKISGFAGCNYFGGMYTKSEGYLTFSDIYTTRRACPDLDIEQQFLDLINNVNRFEIQGNDLYLYQDKLVLLHFVR